jgi:membrane peptidoglycan carboxypeptidase
MSEDARIRTRLLAKLAATIVVAGALLAGLLLPWVGGTGLVARSSASLLDALPVELTDKTPAGNSTVLAADGSLITNFYSHNRTPVTPDQIADVMKRALVDIEDSRFYEHNGLDVQGTLRALVTNVAAGKVQEGGSTLTQQLVKQTLLQTATTPEERQAAKEQTVGRKLKEARLALALEQTYSKEEILTRYLNIVYFGKGAYGIQAAAQRYFSVNAADLTLAQAAMLAGLVQSPFYDDPIDNPENAKNRRNQVLQRMLDLGHITEAEFTEISAQPVAVAEGADPANGCIDAAVGAFFCDYVYSYLTRELGLSANDVKNGGLTIQTTLQPDLQRSADQAVLDHVAMGQPLVGVLDAVQPGTGHVLAMSVNRRYGCSDTDCESVNLNVAPSQGSGSTYKVFTAAAALSEGFGANYTLSVPQPYTSRVYKLNGGTRGAPYVVSNDNPGYASTYNMTSGLVASANTYFVGLEDALGSVEGPVKTAQAMGMHFDAPNQQPADWYIDNAIGSFTLGPEATSPLDLASAYSTVAAGGTQCDPTPVTKILDSTGQPLKGADGQLVDTGDHCTAEAIKPGVANTLANMMIGVVTGGTGRRAAIPGHDIAGKTGTTQENKTAAFGGITPNYAVSVMYFDPLGKIKVGGEGGGVPATIFHDAMAPILANQPNTPFPPADPAVAAGTRGRGYAPPTAPAPDPAPAPGPNPPPAPAPNPAPPADNQPPADNGGANGGTNNVVSGGRRAPGGGGGGGRHG